MRADGELCDPSSPRWADALGQLRHDIYHDPAYVALDAEQRAGRPVCFVYEQFGHVLALPLILREIPHSDRLDATSPYGYPGPVSDTQDEPFWDAAMGALTRTLRQWAVVSCFVRLHPMLPAHTATLARGGTLVHHGDTVSIDLRLPEEEIWRRFRKDHRTDINRARRLRLVTVVDDWQHLDAIVAIFRQTMLRVNASDEYAFSDAYFEGLRRWLDDRVHLAAVLADGTPIGGGVLFEHGGIVHSHLGGTHSDHISKNPSKLEIDDLVRWARARGNDSLHIGGGVGGSDGALFTFKAGFSDRRHAFHTWRIVVDAVEYRRLVSAANRDTSADGHFPGYRVPRLPATVSP